MEIRSFVSVLRSPVTPFDRSKTKNANCFKECNVFGSGKCELSAIQDGRKRCKFLARKSAKLFANTKVPIFGKEMCKTHRQFQRYYGDVTSVSLWISLSLFLSLSLSLSLSFSLTERTSRTIDHLRNYGLGTMFGASPAGTDCDVCVSPLSFRFSSALELFWRYTTSPFLKYSFR